ncbi:MAG: class I SAM-dependent methyltransferase [Microthrixaceae bacterium]
MDWDGQEYQQRFDALAASGASVHGEAEFVMRYNPHTVLDAGCGTGRVGIELATRGVTVVGADPDSSMLKIARALAKHIDWHEESMVDLDLQRTFDLVLMAGNVVLFTPPGTSAALFMGCTRHLALGGLLINGFQLGRGYSPEQQDADCEAAGLRLQEQYSTWQAAPFDINSDYRVTVHVRVE